MKKYLYVYPYGSCSSCGAIIAFAKETGIEIVVRETSSIVPRSEPCYLCKKEESGVCADCESTQNLYKHMKQVERFLKPTHDNVSIPILIYEDGTYAVGESKIKTKLRNELKRIKEAE